jgi:hypothetical protein
MKLLLRIASAALLMLAPIGVATPTILFTSPAGAAEGDFCFYDGTKPGLQDAANQCVPDNTLANGASCGTTGLTYSLSREMCVSGSGEPPLPTAPTAPVGFDADPNAGTAPIGELQPMCTNASPFIGGGMFVVSGTVLCYTGAGRDTAIYSYTSNDKGPGWDPLNPQAWDSLALTDIYASGDVTVAGTLSVFGGAQIYSLDGKNGIQVNNDGLLLGSVDGNNEARITTRATEIHSSVTDGIAKSSTEITPGKVEIKSDDGTSDSSLTVEGGKGISLTGEAVADGNAVSIYGKNGSGNASAAGVRISGDGQGSATYAGSGPAPWADVLVASKSYNGTLGTAVIVNDYGATTKVGSSSMVVVQGALDFHTGGATSVLSGATQDVSGGSSTVMAGASGRQVVVGDDGRMTVVNGVAAESSTSMHVTNGYGTTNGVMANERMAVMSGGTSSPTSMVLDDYGAHFSGPNGGPVAVSGVADGSGPFQAANMRQLDGGIASIAALAGIPAPTAGKNNSLGIGMGHHGSGAAVALGGQSQLGDLSIKYGASVSYSGGLVDSSTMLGVGMSW